MGVAKNQGIAKCRIANRKYKSPPIGGTEDESSHAAGQQKNISINKLVAINIYLQKFLKIYLRNAIN